MNARNKGLAILAVHVAMVCAVAGKNAFEVATLPRAWARADIIPQGTPMATRYVQLRVCPARWPRSTGYEVPVRLRAEGGNLVAEPGPKGSHVQLIPVSATEACLSQPIQFFLGNTSVPANGSNLSVELIVPENEPPRPLRLAVRP